MNTSLVDRAMIFAINAHANTERKGTDIPYSTHVLEAAQIAATMTSDQEIIAAAALHDVVEDTKYTYDDIEKEFGKRVSDLVKSESDDLSDGQTEENWYERKAAGIERVKNATRDEQIVAMGDKLSNLRAIYRDSRTIGEKFWTRFHESDPKMHKWRFEQLVLAFDKVMDTYAFKEFKHLVMKTFDKIAVPSEIKFKNGKYYLNGKITKPMFEAIEKEFDQFKLIKFDLTYTYEFSYALIHHIMHFRKFDYRFQFVNCNERIFGILTQSGLSLYFSVLKAPRIYSLINHELYGEGYTSLVYSTEDHDSIAKMYKPMVKLSSIEAEKLASQGAAANGLDTPLSGEIIQVDDMYGLTFEQIQGKKSIARLIADQPERVEELVTEFAKRCYKLHHTKCLKSYFGNVKERYSEAIDRCGYDEKTKEEVRELLRSVPESDVCSHGDMHIGNMIYANGRYMFIDLADFAYGNPLFDLGTFYFIMNVCEEERFVEMYHFGGKELRQKVWDTFTKEYFRDLSKEEFDEQMRLCKKYSGFQMLFFFSRGEWTERKAKLVYNTLFEK